MAVSKVTLRRREVKDDKLSLYLDYYPPIRIPETMQETRRESLGIYIYKNPKNQMELEFNRDMLDKGEAVRCMRQSAIISEEYGMFDKLRHDSSKPINITWKLSSPIPAKFYKKSNKLMVV